MEVSWLVLYLTFFVEVVIYGFHRIEQCGERSGACDVF